MENWKDIKGYEGYYQVSDFGNVRSLDRYISNGKSTFLKKGKDLKASLNNYGYKRVGLWKDNKSKHFCLHSLVAIAFLNHIPNGKNDIVVDHINEIKTDNKLVNLRLIDNRENVSRKKRGSSKYTGVHWHIKNKKWHSNIYLDGKRLFLGSFDSEIEAHKKYVETLKNYKNGRIY